MTKVTSDVLTQNAVLQTETVTQQLDWRYATKVQVQYCRGLRCGLSRSGR